MRIHDIHNLRRLSLACITLSALAGTATAQARGTSRTAPSRTELIRRLDSLARDASLHVPSLNVAVLRGQDTLLLGAYGLADREHNLRATPATIYEIASLTKQITASAVMRLVEQGKLQLTDDIGPYVPQLALHGNHVTVEQLLNHTSGVHNFTDDPHPETGTERHDAVLKWIAPHPFDFAPGTKVSYSNTGYTVLGLIIEKITGRPYGQFVEQELFAPLGLKHTNYCETHPTDSTVARGYQGYDTGYVRTGDVNMEIPFAAGAICSTAGDYAAWERAFVEGKVVKPASVRRMMTPDTLRDGSITGGFGIQLGRLGDHVVFAHGGGITGFASAEVVLPRDSVAVVVFTNAESKYPSAQPLAFDLARIVIGYKPNGFGGFDRTGHISTP